MTYDQFLDLAKNIGLAIGFFVVLLFSAQSYITAYISKRREKKQTEKISAAIAEPLDKYASETQRGISDALANVDHTLRMQRETYDGMLAVKTREMDYYTQRLSLLEQRVQEQDRVAFTTAQRVAGFIDKAEQMEKKATSLEAYNGHLQGEIVGIQSTVTEIRAALDKANAELETKGIELAERNQIIDEKTRRYDQLSDRMDELEKRFNKLVEINDQLTADNATKMARIAQLELELAQYTGPLAKTPPTGVLPVADVPVAHEGLISAGAA